MAEISPGWGELLALVRQYEDGRPLPAPDQRSALQLAVTVGLATVPGAVGCSISVQQPDGGFVTPSAAGPAAIALDEVQYAAGDGPCLQAARTGRPERLDPFAGSSRWPEFARQGLAHGVASSLSLPLLTAETPAALNLYGGSTGAFGSTRATAIAGVVARAASALLMGGHGSPVEELSAARMHRALTERTLITRAQGVLMERERVSAAAAYRRLAVRSSAQARPLWEVAQQLLESEARSQEAPESEAGSASSAGEDVSA